MRSNTASRFEVVEVSRDEANTVSSPSQIIEDDMGINNSSFISIKSDASSSQEVITEESRRKLERDAEVTLGLLSEAGDVLKQEELSRTNKKERKTSEMKYKTSQRFNVTYETPGQDKDSDLRIEEDTPNYFGSSVEEQDHGDISQSLFNSAIASGKQQSNTEETIGTMREYGRKGESDESEMLSAIVAATSATTSKNDDMNKKLDAIIKRLDGQGSQETDASGNPGAKYKALISDAKKFQRKTITFTNQVIDMANQWDLQRQRIQRLEKEKGKLEDQLKEARLIIEQLQSKQL
jgi:hypothetical protein